MFRFIEDWKTRKRIKAFLKEDPGYLNSAQQAELGLLVPDHLHENWAPDFLLGGFEPRKPDMLLLFRGGHGPPPYPKRPYRKVSNVHPALEALRNTRDEHMKLIINDVPIR